MAWTIWSEACLLDQITYVIFLKVLDDAAEVHLKRETIKKVGRIMLKGDAITLIQEKKD